MPSIWTIFSIVFLCYMTYNLWHLYDLYMPKSCNEGGQRKCITSYLARNDVRLQLRIYTSTHDNVKTTSQLKELHVFDDLDPTQTFAQNVSVDIPLSTRRNGSLYAYAFVMPAGSQSVESADWRVMAIGPLTKYAIPEASTFKLLGNDNGANKSLSSSAGNKPVSHFCSVLPLSLMTENFAFDRNNVFPDLSHYLKKCSTMEETQLWMIPDFLAEAQHDFENTFLHFYGYDPVPVSLELKGLLNRNEYLPILIYNEMFSRVKDLVPLNTSSKVMELSVDLQLIGIGKLRLWSAMSASLEQLTGLGFTSQDLDDVKGLFVGSNIYLLLLTMMVSVFHLLFDFLAFKNDISFWRQKDNIVGLSTKAVVWRCLSTTIIFFYLQDQKTSYLVLIPMGIAAVIEYWKTLKALKITITWHGIQDVVAPLFNAMSCPSGLQHVLASITSMRWIRVTFEDKYWQRIVFYGQLTEYEQATEQFEHEAMRKLYWVLGPSCAVGAVYSLLYTPHKGWYSWLLQSLVNGVYAFGFIFMLPQLYINYKLKSVAHLPWKTFMYKAFNTFIDDIFAFIITMPTSHRLACFRDDAVFIVYLVQRWLYPVDKQRVNEYGQSFDDNKKTQ